MTRVSRSSMCSCGAALTDTFLCPRCAERYARQLGDLPALVDEAIVTLTRQDRITRRNGGRSAERPLAFSWDASVAIETVTLTLTPWIAEIEPDSTIGIAPVAQVGFLLRHRAWVMMNPLGPQLVEEADYLHGMLRRTVDLPTQRWFAGFCSHTDSDSQDENACAEPLYGRFGASQVRCSACGAVYTATERREWLIREAENSLLPLRIIWAALGTLAGNRPPWNVVRRWPERRLHARGLSLDGEELFNVGEVLDLVHTYPARTRRAEPALV